VNVSRSLRIEDTGSWVRDHQSQRWATLLRSDSPHSSQQFLKRFPLHRGDAAVVVKENFVAAKLTGDYPPTAAENLKFFLTLNADAKFEALHGLKRIVNVSH